MPLHIINDRDVPGFADAINQKADVASHQWDLQGDALKSHLNNQGVIPDYHMDTDEVPVDQQDSNEYQFADRPPIAIPAANLRLQRISVHPAAIPYFAGGAFIPLALPPVARP